ncbi:hypothetical protein HZC53_02860 [Candidatus Uhrbacteria bacterium]|nr:hypothetical protein [Candidatus Uhrbacteria bacterium]
MNDGKKTYAVISGIVALLLVLALAFTVLMGGKAAPKSLNTSARNTVRQMPLKKSSKDTVRATVRTPDMNQVKQSVTVKR